MRLTIRSNSIGRKFQGIPTHSIEYGTDDTKTVVDLILDVFHQTQGVVDRGVGVAGAYCISDAKQLEATTAVARNRLGMPID